MESDKLSQIFTLLRVAAAEVRAWRILATIRLSLMFRHNRPDFIYRLLLRTRFRIRMH